MQKDKRFVEVVLIDASDSDWTDEHRIRRYINLCMHTIDALSDALSACLVGEPDPLEVLAKTILKFRDMLSPDECACENVANLLDNDMNKEQTQREKGNRK